MLIRSCGGIRITARRCGIGATGIAVVPRAVYRWCGAQTRLLDYLNERRRLVRQQSKARLINDLHGAIDRSLSVDSSGRQDRCRAASDAIMIISRVSIGSWPEPVPGFPGELIIFLQGKEGTLRHEPR